MLDTPEVLNFPWKLIIDELELTEGDKRRILAGEDSDLERLLRRLRERNIYTWVVIGTTSLLETSERAESSFRTLQKEVGMILSRLCHREHPTLSEARLTEVLSSAGCRVAKLEHVMRNSMGRFHSIYTNILC